MAQNMGCLRSVPCALEKNIFCVLQYILLFVVVYYVIMFHECRLRQVGW